MTLKKSYTAMRPPPSTEQHKWRPHTVYGKSPVYL